MSSLPELPKGWVWSSVREVGEVKLGRQRSPEHHSGPNMRPYLRVANVYDARLDLSDVLEMNFTPNEFETFRLRSGDVLVNEGQSLEWVGRSAIYRGEVPNACFQNTLIRFRAKPCVLPEFALLVFRHYLFSQRFRRIAKWTTNIAHLGSERFAAVEFPLPPLGEQRRIVEEADKQLTRLDAGVEALKRVQAQLKRYRASVLKSACEGRLVPIEAELARQEKRDYEPGDKLLERILRERREQWEADQFTKMKAAGNLPKDDKWKAKHPESKHGSIEAGALFSLPRGWVWSSVREVGEVKLGRQRSPEHHSGPNMRPYLRVANVYDARLDLSDVLEMNFTPNEFETFRLRSGDVLVNEGQSLEWVGRSAIYRGEVPNACFQNTLIRFRAKSCVLPEFALLVFRHYLFSQRFRRIAKWTTNIAHLGADRFGAVEFPLPPLVEQHRIVQKAEELLSVGEATSHDLAVQRQRSEQLRHRTLALGFSGQLLTPNPSDYSTRKVMA